MTSSKAKANAVKSEETVVIVGGGSGGIHTIESLRMVSPLTADCESADEVERVRGKDRCRLGRVIGPIRQDQAVQGFDCRRVQATMAKPGGTQERLQGRLQIRNSEFSMTCTLHNKGTKLTK